MVRVDQLYSRALLTPFTKAADLTPGDRRSYTGQARAERQKGCGPAQVTPDPADRAGQDPDRPAG
jgi:hypothetical protein